MLMRAADPRGVGFSPFHLQQALRLLLHHARKAGAISTMDGDAAAQRQVAANGLRAHRVRSSAPA